MAFATRFSARSTNDSDSVVSCESQSLFPCHHNNTSSGIESVLYGQFFFSLLVLILTIQLHSSGVATRLRITLLEIRMLS